LSVVQSPWIDWTEWDRQCLRAKVLRMKRSVALLRPYMICPPWKILEIPDVVVSIFAVGLISQIAAEPLSQTFFSPRKGLLSFAAFSP
jgi:hypothetical protein